MYSTVFCYDYNWAVLFVSLIVLYCELKNYKEDLKIDFRRDFLLGILVRNKHISKTNNRTCFSYCFCWI